MGEGRRFWGNGVRIRGKKCGKNTEKIWDRCEKGAGRNTEKIWDRCGKRARRIWKRYGTDAGRIRKNAEGRGELGRKGERIPGIAEKNFIKIT